MSKRETVKIDGRRVKVLVVGTVDFGSGKVELDKNACAELLKNDPPQFGDN